MNEPVLKQQLTSIFSKLRHNGLAISISELLDGLRVLENYDEDSSLSNQLQEDIRLLWLSGNNDPASEIEFNYIWKSKLSSLLVEDSSVDALSTEQPIQNPSEDLENLLVPENDDSSETPESQLDDISINLDSSAEDNLDEAIPQDSDPEEPLETQHRQNLNRRRYQKRNSGFNFPIPKVGLKSDKPDMSMSNVSSIPVPFDHKSLNNTDEIFAYSPISKLSMAYAWRYLRRPVADGPANILDIESTIKLIASQGFFLAPLYNRRLSNHAHLMLLIDEGGSMVPFRYITQDLVETAHHESSIKLVDVFYFHNFLDNKFYKDRYLTDSVDGSQVTEACTMNTSILIVSDAGAARGSKNFERIRATVQMFFRLKQRTNLIAWLNPMPESRWKGSSAQILAGLLQMFQMDSDGFSNAIDMLQGRGIM